MVSEPGLVSRLSWEKETRFQMESEKAKIVSRNPNPRSEVAKAGVGKWYLPGTYLAATTVIGVVLTRAERTDKASRALAGPPPLADARDRRKGIAVKPLDGGVLSLVWNGLASEGTLDGATTFLPGPPWVVQPLDLADASLGKGEETPEKGRDVGGLGPSGTRPLHYRLTASHGAPPIATGAYEGRAGGGGGGMKLGFQGSPPGTVLSV
jgi:hypothetical protein